MFSPKEIIQKMYYVHRFREFVKKSENAVTGGKYWGWQISSYSTASMLAAALG